MIWVHSVEVSMSQESEELFLPLQESHLDQVYHIEKSVYEDPWTLDLINQSLYAPMTYCRGLFRNNRCIAYAIYQVIFTEGHILNLAVHPDFQRRGIGKKILKLVLDDGRYQGAQSFFLEVRPSNDSAKKMYESFGFKTLFRRPHYYSNGEDAFVMTLHLDALRD